MSKIVLIQAIQFNISTQLWARVEVGAMAMKEYFAFPIATALLKPNHQIVWCHIRTLVVGLGGYPFVEKQLLYSAAPADWARYLLGNIT